MNNNWSTGDGIPPEPFVPPFSHDPYAPSLREARVVKHVARMIAADDMLADGQISKVERDAIRDRMIEVIENPNT